MPYDQSLDESLWQEKVGVGEYTLEVKVMRYNNGVPKISLQRFRGEMFSKLGRLTVEEAEAMLPLIEKAAQEIKKL